MIKQLGSVELTPLSSILILIMTPVFLVYFRSMGRSILMLVLIILRNDKPNTVSLWLVWMKRSLAILVGFLIDAFIGTSVTLAIVLLDWSMLGLCHFFGIGQSHSICRTNHRFTSDDHLCFHRYGYDDQSSWLTCWLSSSRSMGIFLSAYRGRDSSPDYHYGTLLLSSNIYGIIGMVVAIPVYWLEKKLKFLGDEGRTKIELRLALSR